MSRLTDGRVVHVEVAANGADNHLTRVHTHPNVHRHARGPVHLLGVSLHRFLHPQGGVARPHRVVLVGERGPEEGHDPVAHDSPFVAMDGLHHAFEHGIE
jgi:hypothetical protein